MNKTLAKIFFSNLPPFEQIVISAKEKNAVVLVSIHDLKAKVVLPEHAKAHEDQLDLDDDGIYYTDDSALFDKFPAVNLK